MTRWPRQRSAFDSILSQLSVSVLTSRRLASMPSSARGNDEPESAARVLPDVDDERELQRAEADAGLVRARPDEAVDRCVETPRERAGRRRRLRRVVEPRRSCDIELHDDLLRPLARSRCRRERRDGGRASGTATSLTAPSTLASPIRCRSSVIDALRRSTSRRSVVPHAAWSLRTRQCTSRNCALTSSKNSAIGLPSVPGTAGGALAHPAAMNAAAISAPLRAPCRQRVTTDRLAFKALPPLRIGVCAKLGDEIAQCVVGDWLGHGDGPAFAAVVDGDRIGARVGCSGLVRLARQREEIGAFDERSQPCRLRGRQRFAGDRHGLGETWKRRKAAIHSEIDAHPGVRRRRGFQPDFTPTAAHAPATAWRSAVPKKCAALTTV